MCVRQETRDRQIESRLSSLGENEALDQFALLNKFSVAESGRGGVHGDLNQRILVCLVQTHMVTVGVHGEGYLNTHPPCELYTLL